MTAAMIATIAAIAAIHAAVFALRAVVICSSWEASLRKRSASSFSASHMTASLVNVPDKPPI
jgi:hypothetical protein